MEYKSDVSLFTNDFMECVSTRCESAEEKKVNCWGTFPFKDYLLGLLFCKTVLENYSPRYFLHLKNLTVLNMHTLQKVFMGYSQKKFIG